MPFPSSKPEPPAVFRRLCLDWLQAHGTIDHTAHHWNYLGKMGQRRMKRAGKPEPARKTAPPVLRLLQTLLCLPCFFFPAPHAHAADPPRLPRVLVVNSFGSRAPPFTTHSTSFETTLTREIGTQVDLDEVSLDMARFDQPDMENAFADLLLKRLSKWQPDLVISFGSPAGRFVASYRDRLFPNTPIVYDGMDQSRLPPGALNNNAAFVGSNFDLKGLIDDILQLKPDTNHIVVILGATPLERYWASAFDE